MLYRIAVSSFDGSYVEFQFLSTTRLTEILLPLITLCNKHE